MGRPRLIRGKDIKPGAVVINAGYNPGNVGDVDFGTARTRARLITPVPGGVRPMAIAIPLAQTVDAAASQLGIQHHCPLDQQPYGRPGIGLAGSSSAGATVASAPAVPVQSLSWSVQRVSGTPTPQVGDTAAPAEVVPVQPSPSLVQAPVTVEQPPKVSGYVPVEHLLPLAGLVLTFFAASRPGGPTAIRAELSWFRRALRP